MAKSIRTGERRRDGRNHPSDERVERFAEDNTITEESAEDILREGREAGLLGSDPDKFQGDISAAQVRDAPAIASQRISEKRQQRRRTGRGTGSGRRGTILTSGRGLLSPAPISSPTLTAG